MTGIQIITYKMTLTSTNPTVIDGIEYPYFLVNLAMSPYEAPKGASVALRLTPYRNLENGEIEQQPDYAKAVSLLDIFETAQGDPAFETMIQNLIVALQTLVNDKGL